MNTFLVTALLVTVVLSAFVLNRCKTDLNINSAAAVILAFVHTVLGVICVKVFAGLESLSNPLTAGMSLFGAIFILPFIYLIGSRLFHRRTALVFDDFCLCVMIALMCVRFNCIVSGCCTGKVISGTGAHWPTRQAEIVFWAVMLVWFLIKKKRGYLEGSFYPLMMTVYGIFRFFIEFLRDETAVLGGFHFGHIWAVVSFITGSAFYFYFAERRRA